MAAVNRVPAAPPGALYDARRRLYYAKPVLRGWLHAVWFGTSLATGPLLVARGHGPGTPRSRSSRPGPAANRIHLARDLARSRSSQYAQ